MSCYGADKRFLLAVASPLVLLTLYPFPLFLWQLLRKSNGRKYIPLYLITYYRHEPLSTPMRVALCRTVVFALLLGLCPAGVTLQILCSASALYLCLHLHIRAPQYTSQLLVVAEGMSLFMQAFLCACGLYFSVKLEISLTVHMCSAISY